MGPGPSLVTVLFVTGGLEPRTKANCTISSLVLSGWGVGEGEDLVGVGVVGCVVGDEEGAAPAGNTSTESTAPADVASATLALEVNGRQFAGLVDCFLIELFRDSKDEFHGEFWRAFEEGQVGADLTLPGLGIGGD